LRSLSSAFARAVPLTLAPFAFLLAMPTHKAPLVPHHALNDSDGLRAQARTLLRVFAHEPAHLERTRLPVRKRFLTCEARSPKTAKQRSLVPSVFAHLHVARGVLGVLAQASDSESKAHEPTARNAT
jgi:hypothetical protein